MYEATSSDTKPGGEKRTTASPPLMIWGEMKEASPLPAAGGAGWSEIIS